MQHCPARRFSLFASAAAALASLVCSCGPSFRPVTIAAIAPAARAPAARSGEPRPPAPPASPDRTPGCEPEHAEPPPLIESPIDVAVPPIVDPDGSMAPFYERVAELIRGRAGDHVRIAVFGDSNMTMDWMTGEMRRTLQARYGDGGHGYVALARPWRWYKHMDVRTGAWAKDWTAFAVSTHPAQDHCYGFAGIAARSERAGAMAWVQTAEETAPIGTKASRFELYYLRKPGAGAFDVRLDDRQVASVDASGDRLAADFYRIAAPDGPHRVEFVASSPQPVVLFGVTMERESPSVIVDSLGIGAVSGPLLLKQEPEVMKATLAHRRYDLVVLLLGSNQVWPEMYEKWMAELIARFREALPRTALLVLTPVDQVESLQAWRSAPSLSLVARQNKRIASDNHTAFWDFRGAMGGDASMIKFMATGMGQADGIHLTPKGSSYMGRRLVHAIWRGLDRYLEDHPRAGCVALAPSPRGT